MGRTQFGPRDAVNVYYSRSLSDDFQIAIDSYCSEWPEEFKSIPTATQIKINSCLSLIFLCGTTPIDKPGISSLHLNGTMAAQVRRINTGFIKVWQNPNNFEEEIVNTLHYLKSNNILYQNIDKIPETSTSQFTIELIEKMKSIAGLHIREEFEPEQIARYERNELYVKVYDKEQDRDIFMKLELALHTHIFPLTGLRHLGESVVLTLHLPRTN